MDNKKIGLFITVLRKNKKMTQQDLADKLYVSDKAVSKWERGICMPDISILDKLAFTLEVSIGEILKGEKIEKITKENSDQTLKESISFFQKMYFKQRIFIIFLILIGTLIFSILIDSLNAYIFKKSPIISTHVVLENAGYVDKGVLFNVYYCYHSNDVVFVSWKFKTSKFNCPEIKEGNQISVIDNVFIKTYVINKIEKIQNENSQYWTVSQDNGEIIARVKVNNINLKIFENIKYQIIFRVKSNDINENIKSIFQHAEIIHMEETDKDVNQFVR